MPSTLRTRFMLKYRSMSKEQRMEVMQFDGQPCTWNVFMIEIYNYTKMGQEMLRQLNKEGKL